MVNVVRLVNINNYALKDLSLEIRRGEIHIVFGPNGAGKTTLLRVVAGLTKYNGHVFFDDKIVDRVHPGRRGIGYLPQSNALFPHMTVLENVMYGLLNRGLDAGEARSRAMKYLELLGVHHLKNRYPLKLSGGEQRRVALARALAVEPEILLLDEPFSNIHYDSRVLILSVLENIVKERSPVVVIVTHDIDEAFKLGQRYTLLVNGRSIYTGGLTGLINTVDKHLTYLNVYRCRVEDVIDNTIALTRCGDTVFKAPIDHPVSVGEEVLVSFPMDKVVVFRDEKCISQTNCFEAKVVRVIKEQGFGKALLELNDIYAYTVNNGLKPGEEIRIRIPIRGIRMLKLNVDKKLKSNILTYEV